MNVELVLGALLATAFFAVVEIFYRAGVSELREVLKLIVQFGGALLIARVAVGWALSRFKSEKMWDRRITALADVLAALREMVRILDKWMEEELHAVRFTDDYKAKLEERWHRAQSKFQDVAAVDASLIAADANKQRSIPGSEWIKQRDPETASRAVKEYMATLDDAAFGPLVSKKDDAYKKVLETATAMATEGVIVRGVPVTEELYDIILFLVHSFVRPIVTELYAIKHSDITVADNPDRLIVIIRNGKTGFRAANTMSGAVPVYKRIQKRNPDAKAEDFIFLPEYANRQTASRIIQRQFHELLARTGFDKDPTTQSAHTLYSLRHTAICMRIILSDGQVNIFNLAKNAGTSVDQIERFYARNLPLSKEMARNLQSFGSG